MPDSQYIHGLDELEANIQRLTDVGRDKDARKILRRAMSQGGRVVREDLRATAPRRRVDPITRKFPKLYKDIRQSLRFLVREAQVLVRVGPRKSKPVARWYEFGTSRQPARPWMRPSFERTKQPALDKIVAELKRMVEVIRPPRG